MASSPTVSDELPEEVVTCLKNARYLHLATSDGAWPHVSLMNYTYLPSPPHPIPSSPDGPIIILTIQPSTKKSHNLHTNHRVSLLVHDWVSHRTSFSSTISDAPEPQSSLADLLTNINTAALSNISATMFGYAQVLEAGSEAEKYYREVHERNNSGGGESSVYLRGQDSRVAVVSVAWVRISDYRGGVKDWVLRGKEQEWRAFEDGTAAQGQASSVPMTSGV